MAQYKDFIPENIALSGVRRIGIYDAKGNRVGQIPLGSLTPPTVGKKLYSFGALSDIHLQYETAQADFKRALTYLNETEDVEFTCISGDLTSTGSASEMEQYKNYVDTYSPDTPVYAVTGNHDPNHESDIAQYTGKPLYYTVEQGDDVFIMVGITGTTNANLFAAGTLQWLYETLEANRNKRCFVFHHVRPQDGCGNAFGIYNYDIWGGTEQTVFESLMTHYKNAHQFHGHSHLKFYLQYGSDIANIDHKFGGWSIHVPSLAVPRDGDPSGASSRKEVYADSEGYVVDVYENGIHLRGRDFVKGEFLPIASYWLDTTLQTIPAGTYTDSTGTITT
jgi:3',5'-cyclic AMP phosphodiesterase CpdA